MGKSKVLFVSAADSNYFPLLEDLIASIRGSSLLESWPIAVLDVGLSGEQRRRLVETGVSVATPGWDATFPGQEHAPSFFRAMTARPHIPKYFPGHDVYLWIDADAWIQDDTVIADLVAPALRGSLAIVPEIDRGYWTINKAPKLWGQNQKSFAWGFGLSAGYRLGRHPILNSGVFALAAAAPHWDMWAEAHRRSLNRRRFLTSRRRTSLHFFLSEQTALNHAVFAQGAPATFLPAWANWFCGKGDPAWDSGVGMLVEPHAPHRPLGIVHLAGKGMKDRVWRLKDVNGGSVETLLTRSAVAKLGTGREPIRALRA
jgi:hypothetical protein